MKSRSLKYIKSVSQFKYMIANKLRTLSILTGVATIFLGSSLAITSSAAYADMSGKHPYYLHALSDLRTARWLEQHEPGDRAVSQKEAVAIRQIDAAINTIKKAAIDDGKNLNDHPNVDAPDDHLGRLQKALQILKHAHADVAREEEDPAAVGLRNRAMRDINAAIRETKAAIFDVQNHK